MVTAALVVGLLIPALLMYRGIDERRIRRGREWWARVAAVGAVAWLATYEPALAALAGAALLQQGRGVPLLAWGAAFGTWAAIRALPTEAQWLVAGGWVAIATGHATVCVGAWAWHLSARLRGGVIQGSREARWVRWLASWQTDGAGLGHRTYLAAYLALVLPLAATLCPPAAVVLLLALVRTCSGGALLALVAGGVVLMPERALLAGGVLLVLGLLRACTRLLELSPRGDSFDGIISRWATATVLLRSLSLTGSGPGGSLHALTTAWARTRDRRVIVGDPHCAPLQYVHEYGLAGAIALAALGWRVWPGLQLGDPWTAAAVAGGVALLFAPVARVVPFAATWWAVLAVAAR